METRWRHALVAERRGATGLRDANGGCDVVVATGDTNCSRVVVVAESWSDRWGESNELRFGLELVWSKWKRNPPLVRTQVSGPLEREFFKQLPTRWKETSWVSYESGSSSNDTNNSKEWKIRVGKMCQV